MHHARTRTSTAQREYDLLSSKLREDFARVVQQGCSFDDEEDELGLRCIGAPVFDAGGRAIAAVSLSGASSQINQSNHAFLVRETKIIAAEISDALAQSVAGPNVREAS